MKTLHDIEQFWDAHPCGETLVGKNQEWTTFFARYDEFRYGTEGHILGELDSLQLSGKKVLEIGIGQAADSEQIIRRGGLWHGLDLTAEAVFRAKTRLGKRNRDSVWRRDVRRRVLAWCPTPYPSD